MKLVVVYANTHRNNIAIQHEGEHFPFSYRHVEIKLTAEQIEKLRPKAVGEWWNQKKNRSDVVYEELYKTWIEVEPDGYAP